MGSYHQSIHLKREILIRLVKAYFSENFEERVRLIPYEMRPKGSEVPFRCCIYKERAVLKDRTIASLGFSIEEDNETVLLSEYAKKSLEREKPEENVLTVLDAACKGCVGGKIFVTDLCQGCVARPCQSSCKFGAVSIINGRSIIDETKCKRCKMCMNECPYNAIVQIKVPCEDACPVGAIHKNETGIAKIDFDKCITCGKCVEICPFAAVHEKSQLIDVLKHLKEKDEVIAMIAPSIVGQFPGSIYQLKTALIKAGFSDVYEVAQGADITTKNEAEEFTERMEEREPFMTTSCCAGYNQLVKKHIPELSKFVSDTKTPLYYTAEILRQKRPDAKLVFISPCVAKRKEVQENPKTDYLINYEELGALFVGLKIDIMKCEETQFETESSRQGRNFGVSGGVMAAVKQAVTCEEFITPCHINGINKDWIKKLKKYAKDEFCPEGNLIEVMCCEGGCVGGNAVINTRKQAVKKIADFTKNSKDIEKIKKDKN